jgi:hypothetical protein
MTNSMSARYETRLASAQTIADIFKGAWKSQLPDGLMSGDQPMFEDDRPSWFASVLRDGIRGKRVLELGPFEGYQTYWLDRLGASEITSVEGNTINFLKCLCVKEIFGLRAHIKLGDLFEELGTSGRYDVVWASGVLYHMQDPIGFIERMCTVADAIYVWTNFFSAPAIDKLEQAHKGCFIPEKNVTVSHDGNQIVLHAREYGIADYEDNIPLYWEGSPKELTYWMEFGDIRNIFEKCGFTLTINYVGEMENGYPVASFAAIRT